MAVVGGGDFFKFYYYCCFFFLLFACLFFVCCFFVVVVFRLFVTISDSTAIHKDTQEKNGRQTGKCITLIQTEKLRFRTGRRKDL